MIFLPLSILAYYLYHIAVFSLASHIFEKKPALWKTRGASFVVNYALFVLMTGLEAPLIVNWSLIAVLFILEFKMIYRMKWMSCIFVALIGASVGLIGTMIMRSGCALALDAPLAAFSNNDGSIKGLPVVLGFLLSALAVRCIDIRRNIRILSTIVSERRVLPFLLVALVLGYLYLCLNLLLYYNPTNSAIVKLWSLKTTVFVSLGALLAIWVSYRVASVLLQARRRDTLTKEIAADERLSAEYLELANRDALTGCYSRGFAERTMDELLKSLTPFTIVFADVDGLKTVNDKYGHDMGDVYIASASAALADVRASAEDFEARYGGDEFLIVLLGTVGSAELSERMIATNRTLRATGEDNDVPFSMSVSWGSTEAHPGDTVASLIQRADQAMYRRKRGVAQIID